MHLSTIQFVTGRMCNLGLLSFLVLGLTCTDCLGGFWRKSPRPKFPPDVLRNFVEGRVVLHLSLASDGSVTSATILKSSGNAQLDAAARETVLRWRAYPEQLTPQLLAKGKVEIIDFKQEAFRGSVYRDRLAWFESDASMRFWKFAPFPSYLEEERRRYHTGTVVIQLRIGKEGMPEDVKIVTSSGYPVLDQSAVNAVKLWRAHREYAGKTLRFPIKFQMSR